MYNRTASIYTGLATLLILFLRWQLVDSVIDNGILGDAYVDCGANHIEVRFDTRNQFKGLVFVKDHLDDPQCRSAPNPGHGVGSGARNAQIKLDFKNCGLNRTRSANPKGIFVSTDLVVAFHPEYLTKFDRVYRVQCFYMEMERILEKEISVKMGPPVMHTKQVPMPVCKYEVLSGGPEGPPVFYATIGQMVYHKWTCESETKDQFCMVVHSCIVDDGNGDRVELIDEKGCARDKFLLQNLDYVSDLNVGKEAHVYKYADRQSMFFDCKITLNIKEPGQELCDVPNCPEPPRRRRKLHRRHLDAEQEMNENSIVDDKDEYILSKEMFEEEEKAFNWLGEHFKIDEVELCMSSLGFGSIAVMNLALLFGSGLLFRNAYKQWRSFSITHED